MKAATSVRTERFEVSFNRIHQSLRKMVRNEAPHFSNLVYKGSKRHALIRTYQEELHQFARLRNAIVHEQVKVGEYIADPHEETVERIEEIADIFSQPNYALSIATKNVITFDMEDSIEAVIHGIQTNSYSQYPIYQQGTCVGLLTARAVVKWFASHVVNSIVDLSEIKVMDILTLESNHPISFAPKSANIFEIEEIFEKAHASKKDLELVIITENGMEDEKPLGVITSWDLIEIEYTLNS